MNGAKILVVDDDLQIRRVMRKMLVSQGYTVNDARSGEEALEVLRRGRHDLVLLDLAMPGMGGLEACRAIRAGWDLAIVILSVRDMEKDKISALDAGADDYVTKPFDLGELIARAKALIRRGKGESDTVLRFHDLEMNIADHTVHRDGKPVSLTGMEYRVLEYLAHRRGAVVSKTELLEHLYDFNWERFSNVIEVYISGLRRKLGDAKGEKLIQTLRGQGYVLRA